MRRRKSPRFDSLHYKKFRPNPTDHGFPAGTKIRDEWIRTLHIQNNIQNHTRQNRKHWDLYLYLMDPYLLAEALDLVIQNGGAEGIDGVTIADVEPRKWAFGEVAQVCSRNLRAVQVSKVDACRSINF